MLAPMYYLEGNHGPVNPAFAPAEAPYAAMERAVATATTRHVATDDRSEAECVLQMLRAWSDVGALLDYARAQDPPDGYTGFVKYVRSGRHGFAFVLTGWTVKTTFASNARLSLGSRGLGCIGRCNCGRSGAQDPQCFCLNDGGRFRTPRPRRQYKTSPPA